MYNGFWNGYPVASKIQVIDPKELLGPNIDGTKNFLSDLHLQLKAESFGVSAASSSELVDAASVPALMAASGVESMRKVVDVANEVIAKELQESIFLFISSLLMLIPGVGMILSGPAFAGLRSLIRLLGTLAETAMAIYDIVQDPNNAIWAVLGLAVGGGMGGRGGIKFKEIAAKRRTFTEKEYKGPVPTRGDLDKIKDSRSLCLK